MASPITSRNPKRRHGLLLRMIAGRIGASILTLFLVSLVVFVISDLLPGDAAQEALGQSATPAQVAALRHEMGLDRPRCRQIAGCQHAGYRHYCGTVAQFLVTGQPYSPGCRPTCPDYRYIQRDE